MKAIVIEEDMMLLMVLLQQVGRRLDRLRNDARTTKDATMVQRELYLG